MAVKRKSAKAAQPVDPVQPARIADPLEPASPPDVVDPTAIVLTTAVPSDPRHQRDSERIQILGEFRGEVMVFQPITIKEISIGGAQVESHFPLQLDSLHDFRLTLGGRSIVLKGRVAHCSISDVDQETVVYRSGVEFVDQPERVHSVIADFIEAIMDGRRAP